MKVKLLKKLRKRFYWWWDSYNSEWMYYDNITVCEHSAIGDFHTKSDRLLYCMLSDMGLKKLFKMNYDRVNERRRVKQKRDLKMKFADKFNH